MAMIIMGTPPEVSVKSYTYGISDRVMNEYGSKVLDYVLAQARHAGVPDEAAITREDNSDQGVVEFRWEWWEVLV